MKRKILMLALAFALVASVASADTGYSFTKTLKKGSAGADVVALQTILISKGLLTMPAGVDKGYFGGLTVTAVKAYQASKNLAAVGQVGPATRAALNAEGAVVTTTTTTTTTGTTATTGTTGITTPGVEGILSVTAGPVSTSVANVGQKQVPVLSVRAQAQNSDLAVQRITLNLGADTKIYNKIYSTIYVMNGSNVVATVPLNSSTVVLNGSNYVVNATGFNIIVPKNTYKDITIAADLYPTIDLSKYGGANSISVDNNGVRAVDGAGIVQYGPSTSISQSITINTSLVDNAQANISTDPSSVQANMVPVTDTTNGQYLGLPVLTFAVNAQNDSLHFRTVKVDFATTSNGASAGAKVSVAYLYQGSTMVQSAAVTAGSAIFNNIVNGTAGASIPVNTTLPYTVKVDVTGVTAGTLDVQAQVNVSGTTILNSQDGTVYSTNGSAAGFKQTVAGKGPAFALASAPTLTKVVSNSDTSGNATTTYTATFLLNVTAVGTDLNFGLAGSSTVAFGTSTLDVSVYANGVASSPAGYNLTVNYSKPTGTTDSTGGFTLSRGQTVQVPVTYAFSVKNPGTNTYALGLKKITTDVVQATFMDGLTAWRTNVQ